MRGRQLAAAVAACLLLMPAPSLLAQDAGLRPIQLESLDTRDYPSVNLVVSMPSDLIGVAVPAQSFEVTENGATVEADVTRVSSEQLDVVLAVDTSGSMRGQPLVKAKSAAADFVGQMPALVDVAVVAFGARSRVVSEFTTDRSLTEEAISRLSVRGETALYDGLIAATELFDDSEDTRRVIVMLSDGGDTVSTGTLEEAIVALLSADARFFAVELQSAENDPEPMSRLGAATNGRVVPAGDPEALAGIFNDIAAAIVNQYQIEFEATSHGATELGVAVTAGGITAELARVIQFPPPPPPLPPPPRSTEGVAVPEPVVFPVVTVPPAPTPEPRAGFFVQLGFLSSRNALLAGVGAIFLSIAGLLLLTGRERSNRLRLSPADVRKYLKTRKESALTGITDRVALFAERSLEKQGRKGQLDRALERAGLTLRSGEFLVMTGGGAFAAYVFGYLASAPITGVALSGAVIAFAWLSIVHKAEKRQKAFSEQLAANLQLMSGSLRAGFGLLQAIDVVAEEARSPSAEEFRRVKLETQLGRDLDEALLAMGERVGGEDFEWVIEGIQIHREIGGDLSDIIDRVADTIRERDRLRRQVKALSAEGRISAVILVILPVGLAGLISVTNPSYLAELTGSAVGRVVIVVGVLLTFIGIGWMRKIIKIDF